MCGVHTATQKRRKSVGGTLFTPLQRGQRVGVYSLSPLQRARGQRVLGVHSLSPSLQRGQRVLGVHFISFTEGTKSVGYTLY